MKRISSKNLSKFGKREGGEPVVGRVCENVWLYTLKSLFAIMLSSCKVMAMNITLALLLVIAIVMFGDVETYLLAFFTLLTNIGTLYATGFRTHKIVKNLIARFDREGIATISKDEYNFCRKIDILCWNEVDSVVLQGCNVFVYPKKNARQIYDTYVLEVDEKEQEEIATLWREYAERRYFNEKVAIPYSHNEEAELIDLMREDFGEPIALYRQKQSKYIYANIIVYEPTETRPYWALATLGAGARSMQTSMQEHIKDEISEYVEYVMYMPKNWVKTERNIHETRNWWVITMLGSIAALPFRNSRACRFGDVVESEQLYHAALVCPNKKVVQTMVYTLHSGKSIEFFQTIRLSASEYAKYTENEYGFDVMLGELFPGLDADNPEIEVSSIAERNLGRE